MSVDIIGTYAPKEATYLVQTTNANLTNEQVLASLVTGLMSVTTGTGVVSSITTSAGLAALLSDETGTGALVFANTPTFITPILGTPTSGNLQNCTGYSISNLSGTSANLASAISDETGTGALVFANTPTLVTPILGTPTSGDLQNCTALPISGLTSSTVTALGVGSIELGHATDTTLSRSSAGVLAVESVVVPTISSTNTFTNKRVTPRVTTEVSSATPTINTDNSDAHSVTALAAAVTSFTTNLTGTPTNFQKLTIRIKDDGTARALAFGASFEAKGVALPTTTVVSKVLTMGFIFDTVTSKWGLVASAQEA